METHVAINRGIGGHNNITTSNIERPGKLGRFSLHLENIHLHVNDVCDDWPGNRESVAKCVVSAFG